MISIIVAISQNGAIGKNNDLLWHLSDDLKRFKAITTGNTVIMGRKTFESLPFRPLKNRRNIVISRTMPKAENYEVVDSVEEAIAICKPDELCYVIGGASIYKAFLPKADELLLTRVYKDFEADTFFPEINETKWMLVAKSEVLHDVQSDLDYQYFTYRK